MNQIHFGEGACEKTRKYLDSYISNELLVETNHDVLRHMETCKACAAEAEMRSRVRAQLKSAVTRESAPADLPVRIRERIRANRPRSWFGIGWGRFMLVAVATVLVCVVWFGYSRDAMPALSDRPGQNAYIQRVSTRLAAVLRVGLRDHIHCSVFRKYPKNPPRLEEMERTLGPAYKGLLPVVRAAVPNGYQIIMAHQCGYAGRKYIHLTFEKDGELMSLVVARKQPGESLEGLQPISQAADSPIYQAAAGHYRVAAFDAGSFLAYVVSDASGEINLQIASRLAPGVRAFLQNAG